MNGDQIKYFTRLLTKTKGWLYLPALSTKSTVINIRTAITITILLQSAKALWVGYLIMQTTFDEIND